MYKQILRRINIAIYLLMVIGFATVQSTVFSYFPMNYLKPDFLLILCVYMGFKRSLMEGALFSILGAGIMEANSGVGNHFFLATYLYAFLIAAVLSKTVVSPDFLSSIGIVAALTMLKKIGLLILLGVNGRAENGLVGFLIYLIPGILVQATLTPACFAFFHWVDMKLHKDEHSEDEYDINKGF